MRPRRRLGALVVVLALGAVGGSTLNGCALSRNGLGTRSSLCFRVLPEATAAVGKSAVFDGVRLLPVSALVTAVDRTPSHRPVTPSLRAVAHETTCQVAFRGNFTPASVQLGWAAVSGPYRAAIVVVRLSDREVVATVLFQSVPGSLHFGHRFA